MIVDSDQLRHPSTNTLLKEFVPITGSQTLSQAQRQVSGQLNNQTMKVQSIEGGGGINNNSASMIKKITKVIEMNPGSQDPTTTGGIVRTNNQDSIIEIQAVATELKDDTQEQWRPGTCENEDENGQKIEQEGCPSFARLVNGMESSTFVKAESRGFTTSSPSV